MVMWLRVLLATANDVQIFSSCCSEEGFETCGGIGRCNAATNGVKNKLAVECIECDGENRDTHFCPGAKSANDGAQVGVDERGVAMEGGAAQLEEHGGGVDALALTRRAVSH